MWSCARPRPLDLYVPDRLWRPLVGAELKEDMKCATQQEIHMIKCTTSARRQYTTSYFFHKIVH